MADPSGTSEGRDELLTQLADEFAARQRRGERPPLEDYCRQHPELADDIRSLFPAMVELERAKVDAGPELAVSETDAPPVTLLGDFRLLREVGRGGMGVVYEAEQLSLGRRMALKLLPAAVFRDPVKKRRFEREAKAAAKLHHTNIVPVHGFGEHDGTPYYVMQFIPGLGLDAVIDELGRLPGNSNVDNPSRPLTGDRAAMSIALARSLVGENSAGTAGCHGPVQPSSSMTLAGESMPSPDTFSRSDRSSTTSVSTSGVLLPGQSGSGVGGTARKKTNYWESVARVGVQVAGALAYAHKQGVLHRDIKPGNLLLDLDGTVWVTDFGLAKADDSDNLTHTGDLLGTLRYMPPEAFDGKSDVRGDIYALGLTLFELVALRPAYQEHDRNKLVKQVTTGDPPRLRKLSKDAPRDLVTIVEKAIEKDPGRRYQSARALADDLQRFVDGRPITARRATEFEKLLMWARRRPAIAGLVAALFLCLSAGAIVSAVFAVRADAARLEAELSRQAESSQRQRAESERRRADITLADMYTSRGLLAGDAAPAEAALWFAVAADQAATAEDFRRQEYNRLRARNWLRQAPVPVAAMSAPGRADQLDFQPRGDLLLARSGANRVVLWSWRDGRQLSWAAQLVGVGSAQFSPDGTTVALGFLAGEAQIRKVIDGELLATIQHPGQIRAVAFNPTGKFLAIASQVARVWDIDVRAFLDPAWNHPQPVCALTFNRTGDRLITTCQDKRARVFAVEGGPDRNDPLYPPIVHAANSSPALIDQDRVLVTVSGEAELTRWTLATGKAVSNPIHTKPRNLQGVVASPDGKWFTTAGYNGPELFAAHAKQTPVLMGHTNLVTRFTFSSDNSMLLSVSWDLTARLWSLPTGLPFGPPLKHMGAVDQCACSHDARYVATAQTDGLIRVWQLPADDPVVAVESGWGQRPRVSFDGRLVVQGPWHESPNSRDNRDVHGLRVVATADGQAAGPDISLPGGLVDSCVCGDNRAVAAVVARGETGQLGVWDVSTARGRFEPISLPGLPLSVAARPGSGQIAVICSTGDLLVVDDKTGKWVLELRHGGWMAAPVHAVQVLYAPDGKAIVSLGGGPAATINVRDADTGQLRFAPVRPSWDGSTFHSMSVSADSRFLATIAVGKNHAQVRDLATGLALSAPLPHPGDQWGLFSVRFSPNGRYLLTGHKDGLDRYWDWQAGKLACPPMANNNESHDVAITPDGRFALTVVGGRPDLHIWELTTGRRIAPPVRLGGDETGWCQTVSITPDGRRALVSFLPKNSGHDLAIVDLEALLSPSSAPNADLALLAELATAQRIELGDLSGLTTDQWQERWSLLRQRNPDLARSFNSGPKSAPR